MAHMGGCKGNAIFDPEVADLYRFKKFHGVLLRDMGDELTGHNAMRPNIISL